MGLNLSNTTPAAPAANVNVEWQTDGQGNVSGYVPQSAVEIVEVDLTAQAANIAATTMDTPTTAGLFRVVAYIVVTTVATTSSTLPSVVITWVDRDNGTTQTLTLTPTSAGNSLTTYEAAVGIISSAASQPIQYATTSYATSGATSMQYALHLRLEAL